MFSPSNKRLKLSKKENEISLCAESGFHEIDLTSTSEFSIPSVSVLKRKSPATRRASLHQLSNNNSTEITQSSGYSSLLLTGSSSSTSLTRTSLNRTPKKRKSEASESDENFFNSLNFVSPLKIRKTDASVGKNCAKLILKEKCPSENVILSSTPIRANSRTKRWGKFSSFHPENFKQFGKSIEDDSKLASIGELPKPLAEHSLNISSFNLSSASFNFSQSALHDIPEHVQDLCKGEIREPLLPAPELLKTKKSEKPRPFYNGKAKFNILGELYAKHDLALAQILSYLDPPSILSLSHVSKEYRNIVKSDKNIENKRQIYLKKHRAVKENKLPASATVTSREISASARKRTRAFGSSNTNQKIQHRANVKDSPASRILRNVQKYLESHRSLKKKCPRCRRPAVISSVKIRNSPRKKRTNIYKLSLTGAGRVQKRARTFLSKTSIESFHEASSDQLYVSLEDDPSKSPNTSSSFDSPNSSGTDESEQHHDSTSEIYEYATCTGVGCFYKFCVKCNCKYHPKQVCRELSPPSPSSKNKSVTAACTRASRKSLRRLAY